MECLYNHKVMCHRIACVGASSATRFVSPQFSVCSVPNILACYVWTCKSCCVAKEFLYVLQHCRVSFFFMWLNYIHLKKNPETESFLLLQYECYGVTSYASKIYIYIVYTPNILLLTAQVENVYFATLNIFAEILQSQSAFSIISIFCVHCCHCENVSAWDKL